MTVCSMMLRNIFVGRNISSTKIRRNAQIGRELKEGASCAALAFALAEARLGRAFALLRGRFFFSS